MHSWKQYHGNGPNQGVMSVLTPAVMKPKWNTEIGKVGYASPVIGEDGVVYIGSLDGNLIAVNSDGSIKWKRAVTTQGNPDHPGIITGSPAVGGDGNIYIITTVNTTLEDRRNNLLKIIQVRRSSLHSFTPAGSRRWSYRFPVNTSATGLGAYTGSSPKVWGDQSIFIFVPAIYSTTTYRIEILVINQSGNLVNKTEVSNYPPLPITDDEACSMEEIKSGWDFMHKPEDVDALIVDNTYEKIMDWPEPTLAVVDFEPHSNHPLIVIEDNYKALVAYRWNFPMLIPAWFRRSNKVRQRTSPVIISSGRVLSSGKDGVVSCYDLENGNEICQPWYQADKSVLGSPVSFDNQTYFVAGDKLILLDANFKIKQHYVLTGKCLGSIALSANHVYVSATDGLYTFSLDLKMVNKNSEVAGGLSTPAINRDGMVYVIDQKGKLWALAE